MMNQTTDKIERGLLFSKLMMEANIEGRKMETRRAIKKMPWEPDFVTIEQDLWCFSSFDGDNFFLKCPYGQPGDILYARETIWTNQYNGGIVYDKDLTYNNGNWKCTPSIHMPKKHSRFWMEVLDVKAERLLDISGNSCVLEGIEYKYNGWRDYMALCDLKHGVPYYDQNFAPRKSYFSLWDSINGKDSHLLNPWVWVIKYKEIPNPNFQING